MMPGRFDPLCSCLACLERRAEERAMAPVVDMVLHCPLCGLQHIDAPEPAAPLADGPWRNPPHRSHLCKGCGHVWRPADVATNGVLAVKTKGKNDSELRAPVYFPMTSRDGVKVNAAGFRRVSDPHANANAYRGETVMIPVRVPASFMAPLPSHGDPGALEQGDSA